MTVIYPFYDLIGKFTLDWSEIMAAALLIMVLVVVLSLVSSAISLKAWVCIGQGLNETNWREKRLIILQIDNFKEILRV